MRTLHLHLTATLNDDGMWRASRGDATKPLTFEAASFDELAAVVARHVKATDDATIAAKDAWTAKLAALPTVFVSVRGTRVPYAILKATATQIAVADPSTPGREQWRFKRDMGGYYNAIGHSSAIIMRTDAAAAGLDAMCAKAAK